MAEDTASSQLNVENSDQASESWHDSLLKVMRDVVINLPDATSLGDLIEATEKNSHLEPLLRYMTVQDLVDMVTARPAPAPTPVEPTEPAVELDEEGNPLMAIPDANSAVVRRRADVPDGDAVVLACLSDNGLMSELDIARSTKVSMEQLRLLLRQLRTHGHIHIEGSGTSRKFRVTRGGTTWLRRQRRAAAK